jgi:ubiquinone/menaquinone biosynthesis C-methylase UbiE
MFKFDTWCGQMQNQNNASNDGMIRLKNVDPDVVAGFGDEWSRFDQSELSQDELHRLFEGYFSTFPWADLPPNAEGFDMGCGSGRWAYFVAPRVGRLHLIDASKDALDVAQRKLAAATNVDFIHASVADVPLPDNSQDFGYSLGVLHHIPDTQSGLEACVEKLKPGAPFLLYLYYRFDNRPLFYRLIWQLSDILRRFISRLPHGARYAISQAIAVLVYWPLAMAARGLEKIGVSPEALPLSAYRHCSFYTMRTDALDRFGTRLEKRFTRTEILLMMERAGLTQISFREGEPYWCASGIRNR